MVASRAWSGREKALGLALLLLPLLLPLLSVVAEGPESTLEPAGAPVVGSDPGSERRTDGGWGPVEVATLSLLFLAGLPSALYLAWRLRRMPSA